MGNKYEKLKKISENLIMKIMGEKLRVQGQKNNNWAFITEDNRYLVKFSSKEDFKRLKIEAKLSQVFGDVADIPVPKVIKIGEEDGEYYLIRTLIDGDTLGNILQSDITLEDKQRLFTQAGSILGKMHNISFDKKGILDENLNIEEHEIFSQKEFDYFFNTVRKNRYINEEQCELLKKIDFDDLYKGDNVLCHCDYAPGNIIAEAHGISGVIDYEWAASAPAYDDLAGFHIFMRMREMEEYMGYFYEGYKTEKTIEEKYFDNLDKYIMYRLITMISCQLDKDKEHRMEELLIKSKHELNKLLLN